MKLMHTTTTKLNTNEFNDLSDKIIDRIYALSPEVRDLYDIHINFIDDEWRIDFLPTEDNLPVIKVDTYTEYENDHEILNIVPESLTDIPGILKFKNEEKSYDLCVNYAAIFDFILSLYDFEYRLN